MRPENGVPNGNESASVPALQAAAEESAPGGAAPVGTGRRLSDHPRWWIYRGTGRPLVDTTLKDLLPEPPPWRRFNGGPVLPPPPPDGEEIERRLGLGRPLFGTAEHARAEADMVNAALYLRRPLLVTGRPGTGKSSLAYRISRELRLGRVLRWHITSRTTLRSGLYDFDAIARVQDSAAARAAAEQQGTAPQPPGIGEYLRLGPLGTALLPYESPRVLLIDELDKSDQDLANDLLSVFEEGRFEISELVRVRRRHPLVNVLTDDPDGSCDIDGGVVRCRAFPIVVITSNGEREFPPAFLRRCLRLRMPDPDATQLIDMVAAHFAGDTAATVRDGDLIGQFLQRSRERGGLAVDQFLNSVYLATSARFPDSEGDGSLLDLLDALWHRLDGAGAETRTG